VKTKESMAFECHTTSKNKPEFMAENDFFLSYDGHAYHVFENQGLKKV
jgi:hypothetical protein